MTGSGEASMKQHPFGPREMSEISGRTAAAALVLLGAVSFDGRVAAQARPEIESRTPLEIDPSSVLVTEPPDVALPKYAVPPLEFDSEELDRARADVLWNRNWFLASGSIQAFGWILLGAALSRCETINGVDVCPRSADNAGTAGAAIVILSGVPLLVTSITYGVRARQKKEIERLTLRDLTDHGRQPPPRAFDRWRLDDAQQRIRAARNGLIASASVFSFGWIFLGAAIPRCQSTAEGPSCTNAGYAHMVVGLTFALSGTIGLLVSGALLGARKKNERVLRNSIQRRQGARFRWDPGRGAFVF
jgi:hypothetical protein